MRFFQQLDFHRQLHHLQIRVSLLNPLLIGAILGQPHQRRDAQNKLIKHLRLVLAFDLKLAIFGQRLGREESWERQRQPVRLTSHRRVESTLEP